MPESIESIKETKIGNKTVTVWRKETSDDYEYDTKEIEQAIRDSIRSGNYAIVSALREIKGVTKVQILDSRGKGFVISLK